MNLGKIFDKNVAIIISLGYNEKNHLQDFLFKNGFLGDRFG